MWAKLKFFIAIQQKNAIHLALCVTHSFLLLHLLNFFDDLFHSLIDGSKGSFNFRSLSICKKFTGESNKLFMNRKIKKATKGNYKRIEAYIVHCTNFFLLLSYKTFELT